MIAAVKENTFNGVTRWQYVLERFPGRTLNQVKTYYCHRLKEKEPAQQWTTLEFLKLLQYIDVYGKKWAFISKNYYPKCSADALRVEYARATQLLTRLESLVVGAAADVNSLR